MDHNTMTLELVCQRSSKKFQILNPLFKKPCEFNWEHEFFLVLIKAKRDEHITVIDMVHGPNNFERTITKWKKIPILVMNACCS
jgi:hypothetical protein